MESFPILDCASIGLSKAGDVDDYSDLKAFGEQFASVLASPGVCYLKNTGIEEEFINSFMAMCRDFFTKPEEYKKQFDRPEGNANGWVPSVKDRYDYDIPADLKEGYQYTPNDEDCKWPDSEFERHTKEMYETCKPLAKRLCDSLSLGLGLEKSFIWNGHEFAGTKRGFTQLRMNFYPPYTGGSRLKPGQVRFCEHADFGTFAFLFQDDSGGLEVEIPGKGFVPVTPVPNTVVVLPGLLLQRWTADSIMAMKHRVVIPELEEKRKTARQSIAFFVVPDRDFEIKPFNGSDKYKPITSIEFIRQMLSGTGFNVY